MNPKVLMTFFMSLSFALTYAQNEKANRDEFVLRLPVDKKQFYEQNVAASPYFVKDQVLQIYPGEKLFIEVETDDIEIKSMQVVKENLNPEKTIIIEFTQSVKDKKSELMMLKIVNPFKWVLHYSAMMYIVGQKKWLATSVIPVPAELTSYETWPDVIITLVLTDWKFK